MFPLVLHYIDVVSLSAQGNLRVAMGTCAMLHWSGRDKWLASSSDSTQRCSVQEGSLRIDASFQTEEATMSKHPGKQNMKEHLV